LQSFADMQFCVKDSTILPRFFSRPPAMMTPKWLEINGLREDVQEIPLLLLSSLVVQK
jgi:hypothetical protein